VGGFVLLYLGMVGASVEGIAEGECVEWSNEVGNSVGLNDGAFVGFTDGVVVGWLVGLGEGATVEGIYEGGCVGW